MRNWGLKEHQHKADDCSDQVLAGLKIIFVFGAVVILVWFFGITVGWPRDFGQWKDNDPAISAWYRSLLQPDTITSSSLGILNGTSCCGQADAYWVIAYVRSNWIKGQEIVAIIDDDRDDEKLGRQHEIQGTQYVVPKTKIVGEKQRVGNPTGHAIIFLGATSMGGEIGNNHRLKLRPVLCYVDNSGY